MNSEFGANSLSPAERALADAKAAFRVAMMGCEPFADLVMAYILDPRQSIPTGLPNFDCEPWRYIDHTDQPNGHGVRLSFSAVEQDEGLHSKVSAYAYIKIARITAAKELFAGVLIEDIEDRQPDATDAEDRTRAIVDSYSAAYNAFVCTEIPADALVVDGLRGTFDLVSHLERHENQSE